MLTVERLDPSTTTMKGFVQVQSPYASLTKKGEQLGRFKGWFTMMIGGYGSTYLQMGEKLKKDSGWATRDATQVGIGSCGISHYDSIPLTKSLMQKIGTSVESLLDLGCGNGLYLVEFCKQVPGISALGVEKDAGACEKGTELIKEEGLSDRVELVSATTWPVRSRMVDRGVTSTLRSLRFST